MFFGLFKQDEQAQAFCVEGGNVYLCTSWVECQVRLFSLDIIDCFDQTSRDLELASCVVEGVAVLLLRLGRLPTES